LPEVDEDFVKAFGVDEGTLEALRGNVRKNMAHELTQKIRAKVKNQVMDVLVQANPLTVPKAMVDQEAERIKRQTMQEMRGRGQSSQFDLPASLFVEQARRRVHLGMLVSEIMKAQALRAYEDDLRATIAEFADSYENPDEVVDYYLKTPEARASIENLVLENKVVDWVLDQVAVNDVPTTFDAVMENSA
jgi:trigger factor